MSSFKAPSWSDIIRYLIKNKLSLIVIPFLVAVIVAGITLMIPNRYQSSANLIPSQRPSLGFDLFSEGGGISSLASSFLGNENEAEANKYIILLSSFTTSKQVVESFDLVKHYDLEESETPLISAIEELKERTKFESKEEGNFVITIEDESPELAKNMADFFVHKLNEENIRISTSDAKMYREFLEKRVEEAENEIDKLRESTKKFQQQYGVFELPTQTEQYFSLISELTARQIETELRLKLLSETVQPSSETFKNTKSELEAINSKLSEIYSDADSTNLYLNFSQLPEISSQYLELLLEAEIQTEIQKFLVPLYEQARMEEAKALPIVSIIDAPRVPEIKSFPKRSLIVIASGISAFILMILYLMVKLNFIQNRAYFQSLTA
jgi:capsule polysaccharide export protein KpsE/RkpR